MSLFNKIKAIKDLRQQAKSMQSVLAEQKVEVDHKGVKIAMDGNMKILSFSLPEELLKGEKKRDAEDAVKSAIDEVIKKAQRVMAEKMKEMGGLEKFGL